MCRDITNTKAIDSNGFELLSISIGLDTNYLLVTSLYTNKTKKIKLVTKDFMFLISIISHKTGYAVIYINLDSHISIEHVNKVVSLSYVVETQILASSGKVLTINETKLLSIYTKNREAEIYEFCISNLEFRLLHRSGKIYIVGLWNDSFGRSIANCVDLSNGYVSCFLFEGCIININKPIAVLDNITIYASDKSLNTIATTKKNTHSLSVIKINTNSSASNVIELDETPINFGFSRECEYNFLCYESDNNVVIFTETGPAETRLIFYDISIMQSFVMEYDSFICEMYSTKDYIIITGENPACQLYVDVFDKSILNDLKNCGLVSANRRLVIDGEVGVTISKESIIVDERRFDNIIYHPNKRDEEKTNYTVIYLHGGPKTH